MAGSGAAEEDEELYRQSFYQAFLFEYGGLTRSGFRRELQDLAGGLDPTAAAAFDRWRRRHSRTDGALRLPDDATYRSATEAWLSAFTSANTRRAYARDLDDWLAWSQGHGIDPLRATSRDVSDHVGELPAAGRPPAASTVNRRLSALSSWYTRLVEHGLAPANPVRAAHRPAMNRDTAPGIPLTAAEVGRLLAAADAVVDHRRAALGPAHGHSRAARRDRALLHLVAELGLPVSEACRLAVIDLQTDDDGRAVIGVGHGTRRRYLPVSPDLLVHLESIVVERRRALALARLARELTYALPPESRQRLLADLDQLHRLPTTWVETSAEAWPELAAVLSRAADAYRDHRSRRTRVEAMTSAQLAAEQPTGLLFATASGCELTQAQVFAMVRRIAGAAGLPAHRIGPQLLRHTAAAAALASDRPLHRVQAAFGLADPRTVRRYASRGPSEVG